MYAIVRTGGKQYRVEEGQSLLVERLPAGDGEQVSLEPLLVVDGANIVDEADGLSAASVQALVVSHERGPKLRVVKFKPKRGYRRRNGHRQNLTRLRVTAISLAGERAKTVVGADVGARPAPVAAEAPPEPVVEAPAAVSTAEAAPEPVAGPPAAVSTADAAPDTTAEAAPDDAVPQTAGDGEAKTDEEVEDGA